MGKYESQINQLKSKIEDKQILNTRYRNRISELEIELSQKDSYWEDKIKNFYTHR